MNTELEHLKKMRELLARGWTQDALARDGEGQEVSEMSDNAVSFCIVGAMYRVVGLLPTTCIRDTLYRIISQGTITWNDAPNRTQSEVLALMDRAIEIAEAEQ